MNKKWTLYYIWLLLFVSFAYGQNTMQIQFQTFTQNDGLSHDYIVCIAQDHLGFLWIGTEYGLNRFDGKHFLTFTHNPEDEGSINGNWINTIFEDHEKNLWIGTNNGLNRLNRKTGDFESILLKTEKKEVSVFSVVDMIEDEAQQLWVTSSTYGLLKLIKNSVNGLPVLKTTVFDLFQSKFEAGHLAGGLIQDKVGNFWIKSSYGIHQIVPTSQKTTFFRFPKDLVKNFPSARLFVNRQGYIIITFNHSHHFYYIDPAAAQPQIRPYHPTLFSKGHWNKSPQQQQVLLSYPNNQLSQLDLKTNQYVTLPYSFDLPPFHIYTLFQDQAGNIWVGTSGSGLKMGTFSAKAFQFYMPDSLSSTAISDGSVRTIQEDEAGNLWVGLLNAGLDQFALTPNQHLVKIQNISTESQQSPLLSSNHIIKMLKDHKGYFWIGLNKGGVNRFDPVTGQVEVFEHIADNPNSLSQNRIWGLVEDKQGYIWVGTFENGLNRLDPKTGEVKRYWHEPKNPNSLFKNEVRSMFIDEAGHIWIGTNAGLNCLDTQKEQFRKFVHDPSNPSSISSGPIWVIYEDKNNNIWAGTSTGLNRLNRATQKFERFYEKDGLPGNMIFGIIEDHYGVLWITTTNGLAKSIPSPSKISFQALKNEDGVPTTAFQPKAYYRSERNRQLYFGSVEGLLVVQPDLIQQAPLPNQLVLHAVSRFNPDAKDGQVMFDYFSHPKKKMEFGYEDKVITFTLADLSSFNSRNLKYELQLQGFNDRWLTLNENRAMTFTNLEAGNYELWGRGKNISNESSKPVSLLAFKVWPPWWKTWWAYVLYLVTISGLLYVFYNFQLSRKLARQEAIRLKELDETKSRFFTNISHEFRTPLTIIAGMAEQVQNKPDVWLKKGSQMIVQNAHNLLQLVNQILDLRKLESNTLKLNMIQADFIPYLRYIISSYDSYAESKGLQLRFISAPATLVMDYDPEKILHIVSNLLSNAIKFTPDGDIGIQVQTILLPDGKEQLQIRVKDSGIGIPASQIPHIFDRFYQIDDSSTRKGEGTGIGLALTKELVHLMKGKIEVNSEMGKGSTFIVILPITRTAILPTAHPAQFHQHLVTSSLQVEKAAIAAATATTVDSALPTLLIVEDHPDLTQFLVACLEENFQLITATNGQEGIDKAIQLVPDIIISDVMMPEKNGFELCDTLKQDERTSHIPIILLTAKVDMNSKIKGLERGADAYLTKPFDQRELLIRLKKLLELRQKLQEYYRNLPVPASDSDTTAAPLEDAFIQKVRQIIEENIDDEKFGITQLCQVIALSRSQLHNKIKALTGLSTSIYMRSIRLQKAKILLETTDLNVSEVGYEVGFKNPSYFSRMYMKEYGLSPKEARNN